MANWNSGHNHFPPDVGVQSGTTSTVAVGANTYADVAVTFPVAFYATPTVVACACGGYGMDVSVMAINASTTGFTCRIYHAASGTSNITANWIAVGTPK